MRAVVFERYGSPDVLELKEVAKPVPKDDEVLIRVRATSLNDWDWQALQGIPFVNRFMFGLFRPRPQRRILGSDVAGRIDALGKDARRFRVGGRARSCCSTARAAVSGRSPSRSPGSKGWK